MMPSGPREILTPYRPIPMDVPEGMKPNEIIFSFMLERCPDPERHPLAAGLQAASLPQ